MIVSATHQNKAIQPDDTHVIHVTEVSALNYPKEGFEYRGLIRVQDERGVILVEQILQTRRKPEWLVNVRHQGNNPLYLSIQSRHQTVRSWQEIGRATFHPKAQLNGQRSTLVDVQLRSWDNSPQMAVRLRLSKGQAPAPADEPRDHSASVTTEAKSGRPTIGMNASVVLPKNGMAMGSEEPESGLPLTPPEQVIVKDSWNKFLAYQDMLIEMFFERLLLEEPDLISRFGDAIDLAPGYFANLFDRCIRQLNPHTERMLRESYKGIYPDSPDGPKTVEEAMTLFADLGMRAKHWVTARRVWVWTMSNIPHLEEYDRENLAKGVQSAMYRFFTNHVMPQALEAVRQYDSALSPEIIQQMRHCAEVLAEDSLAMGIEFYRILFQAHPEVMPYFGRTDVNSLANHLIQAVAFLVRSLDAGRDVMQELRDLARVHANFKIPPDAYPKIAGPLLTVMKQHVADFSPELEQAWGTLLNRVSRVIMLPMANRLRILAQAREFIDQIAKELAWEPVDYEQRWLEIEREVYATGSYTHTYEELAYGAQLAWRNSSKCIGRIAWRNMIVRDLRHVTDPDEMFRECAEHLKIATNGGNLQIVMNVFRPKKPMERWGPRIWNPQYIRFAAYEQEDGSILGDKANVALTKTLIRQGWTPPAQKTGYDVLPLVIEVPGRAPKMYEFSSEDLLKVPIEHPNYPKFKELGMEWCAVPAISNFRMDIGGVQYGCIPFNGWFMETEIARNLWEENRYNKATDIAEAMDLDTSSEQTLWRDRTFLELNAAVLHSFTKAKVTLVDHQTASRQFLAHDQREKRAGRECPAQWSWVTPSAGGSTTPVWHHEMRDFFLTPSYHYAADKWAVMDAELTIAGEENATQELRDDRVLILYGSETGTAEGYARQAARRLARYQPQVMALDDYKVADLVHERVVLVISSTFGDGEMPSNAKNFYNGLRKQPVGLVKGLKFSVMALGSTVYPHFCAAGTALDRELGRIGGNRVVGIHKGDEIKGQADTFRQWLDLVARVMGEDPTSTDAVASSDVQTQVNLLHNCQWPALALGQRKLPGVEVPVVANRELLKEVIAGSRSTRSIVFDLANTGLKYETGDHVAIFPENPAALVQRICRRMKINPEAWFTTSLVSRAGLKVPGESMYPEPVRVWDVLTQDLDLSLREPFDELLKALADFAEQSDDREVLENWVLTLKRQDEPKSQALIKYITDHFVTVADLLDEFPSVRLPFAQLIELLPRQKPRLYSISSCSLVHPEQIHLTVSVAQVTTDAGQTRPGLCSNYLARLNPSQGDTARLSVRTSNFRPPRDPQAPVLMVGPGTGLSPLVGFLQHREVQLRALQNSAEAGDGRKPVAPAPVRLYFGCRNANEYIYQQELETWRETGVLTHLDVAFSRVDSEKVYVQQLLGQQSEEVWKMLTHPQCHYYVCGDAKMADDVFAVLMTIAKKEGGLSHAEAVEFFRRMQAENRFMMDVWGVLLNFKKALLELQEAKYTQGERWLEGLTTTE